MTDTLSGKVAVCKGETTGTEPVSALAQLGATVKGNFAILKPYIDMCSESLSACYPDLYGDDRELAHGEGRFDLLEVLEKNEEEAAELNPAVLESIATINQLVDYFVHMKRIGKGIDESDFDAAAADQSGLLSAIAIAASATDSEFGENSQKAIKAAFYAALAREDKPKSPRSSVQKEWAEKGIELPNLRMPVLSGEDSTDLSEMAHDKLTKAVAEILQKDEYAADWNKLCGKSDNKVAFGQEESAKDTLQKAIKAAGGQAEDWQVEAAGQGGAQWASLNIDAPQADLILKALQKHPCGAHLKGDLLDQYNSPGDLLKDLQKGEEVKSMDRPDWQWADVNWAMVVLMVIAHSLAVWGCVMSWTHPLFWTVWTQAMIIYPVTGMLGITGGAHRLWSHRSYKAHFPARLVMMIANSVANQGTIYHWSRDHRVHHAKSDTEADPHDITRGFFYSHMGWLLLKKRQAVKEAGKKIDCSDLMQDPLVWIQEKGDPFWNFAWSFGLPTVWAHYMYDEALLGFLVLGAARWLLCLHATWTVNSVAHTFGPRPYEPNMYPSESWFTTLVAVGEGYHNWYVWSESGKGERDYFGNSMNVNIKQKHTHTHRHHTYPWDYSASELGFLNCFNPTTAWIDFLVLIGQAYGRKRAVHRKPKHA